MSFPSFSRCFLLTLFFLAASFLISSCTRKTEGGESDHASATPPTTTIVPVTNVVRSNLADNLMLTGEFIPYQEIDVMAKEAGYIKAIKVDIGDHVHAGEFLAELEIPEMQDDLARAAAGVQAAEADIAKAQGDLTRAQSTYDIADLSYRRIADVAKKEPGLVPQQEVDVAHSKQLENSAQVAAAQSNLETAQRKLSMAKAEQARWTTLQKYTVITAPFTGIITKRYANTGAMIQQGTSSDTQALPVVRLSQNNLLRLILPVPESAVPSVHLGETVQVSVSALQKSFPGRVTRFEDKVSTSTRTMNTEVDVPNPDYVLVPGMYAEINLHLRQSKEVLTVPLDAVEESNDSARVYTVRDSTIHIVPVQTGLKTARQQEIRSGLTEGDQVIVGRHTGLEEGQKVQPKVVSFEEPVTAPQKS
jgi:RND family efflux transporter MFP subunit